MSKGRGVSSNTHTRQQCNDIQINIIPIMRHIVPIRIIMRTNAILIIRLIKVVEIKIKSKIANIKNRTERCGFFMQKWRKNADRKKSGGRFESRRVQST